MTSTTPASPSTPVPPASLAGLLREELDRFVDEIGQRRNLRPRVYVGEPGGERVLVSSDPHAPARDAGWRADLVEHGVACVERPACAWILRSGLRGPNDHDLAWWGACRAGFARHGLVLPGFFLMDRHGWLDLETGTDLHFHRIRKR